MHRAAWQPRSSIPSPPPPRVGSISEGCGAFLVATVFSRRRPDLSANQTVPTTGRDLREVGQRWWAAPCPSLPHGQYLPHTSTGRYLPSSKSSRTSATVLGIRRGHPIQSSHPPPPQSSEQASTAPVPAPSLFLSRAPRATQQITVRILGRQAVSQSALSNSGKESLSSPLLLPFPKSILSLPFSTYNGVNKSHIYSAWLGTKVELEVLAVQQLKAETSALKHHKHFKAERKSMRRVFCQKNGAG